jgi:hypothetical protein
VDYGRMRVAFIEERQGERAGEPLDPGLAQLARD